MRPTPVGGGFDAAVVAVACGYGHTLALDVEGRVWSMGSNARGQCGWGEEEPGSATVASMCAHPVLVEGLSEQVVAISAGAFHSAAITAVSELLVWGWNRHGQLGLGSDDDQQPLPAPVAALSGMDVRLVSCAADYTVAVTDHFMSIEPNYFASTAQHSSDSDLHTALTNGDGKEEDKEEEDEKAGGSSAVAASTITRSTSASLSPDTPAPVVFDEGDAVPAAKVEDGDAKGKAQSTPDKAKRKSTGGGCSPSPTAAVDSETSLLALVKAALLIPPLPESLPDELSGGLPASSLSVSSPPVSPTAPSGSLPRSGSSPFASLSSSLARRVSRGKKAAQQSSAFNAMTSAYLSKLHRTAKEAAVSRLEQEKAIQREERLRQEETRRNAKREKAMEDAASEWTKTILPRWSEPKIRQRAREMVSKYGVPTKIRGQVWPVAIGNALMVNAELYKIFSDRANRFKAKKKRHARLTTLSSSTPPEGNGTPPSEAADGAMAELNDSSLEELKAFGKADTVSYIDTDLARTFPSLAFFQEECAMHDQLRSILYVYVFYRPDVGYVQGMSYLAASESECRFPRHRALDTHTRAPHSHSSVLRVGWCCACCAVLCCGMRHEGICCCTWLRSSRSCASPTCSTPRSSTPSSRWTRLPRRCATPSSSTCCTTTRLSCPSTCRRRA